MNESLKVQPHHIKRDAYLYIRQSSMRQVIENIESGKRQYALRTRATALGWPQERIVVIDSDQGESGASTLLRKGFQRLVSEVGMGRAGIVMGLEVSRLARNNADWHRLLEICALTETLILDEDGVYDPKNFNDRLLLGLKGTMSEAELHVLMARLRGGIVNKVRRGEYRCILPTGLVYDHAGDVILDPDSQVRETIAYFFETFSRVGSAHQTVKAFRNQQLLFPSRIRILGGGTQITFRALTASTAMRMLTNPRYAGAYAYGRRHFRRTVDGRRTCQKRDYTQWLACIPNSHPGYISWEQYLENLTVLQSNGRGYELARNSPPREGAALLQGRAVCGRCGRHFRVRYRSCRGKNESWYVCDRTNHTNAAPNCQSISGRAVDEAIAILVAEKMAPEAVELAIQIRKEIEARQKEAEQLRCRAIERAQLEAELAQRRFMMVDPANRLVADTLEADWNDKLREVDKAKQQMQQHRSETQAAVVDDALRVRLVAMTTDFKKLWSDPNTSNREKKRMLAHIIEDVTLLKLPGQKLTKLHVRFKGGKTETLTTANPRTSAQQVQTPSQIVKLVDRLLDDYVYYQIADILNEKGLRPGGTARPGCENHRFDAKLVAYIVHAYGLKTRYDRLRQRGMLTPKEMAARLAIHEQTLARWAKYGIVKRHACNERWYLYESPGPNVPVKQCSRWNRLVDRGIFVQTKNKQSQLTHIEPEEV